MAKFIITHTEQYEIEAENLTEVKELWHNDFLVGNEDFFDFIQGQTNYEEVI